jgi:hypothetical protein
MNPVLGLQSFICSRDLPHALAGWRTRPPLNTTQMSRENCSPHYDYKNPPALTPSSWKSRNPSIMSPNAHVLLTRVCADLRFNLPRVVQERQYGVFIDLGFLRWAADCARDYLNFKRWKQFQAEWDHCLYWVDYTLQCAERRGAAHTTLASLTNMAEYLHLLDPDVKRAATTVKVPPPELLSDSDGEESLSE